MTRHSTPDSSDDEEYALPWRHRRHLPTSSTSSSAFRAPPSLTVHSVSSTNQLGGLSRLPPLTHSSTGSSTNWYPASRPLTSRSSASSLTHGSRDTTSESALPSRLERITLGSGNLTRSSSGLPPTRSMALPSDEESEESRRYGLSSATRQDRLSSTRSSSSVSLFATFASPAIAENYPSDFISPLPKAFQHFLRLLRLSLWTFHLRCLPSRSGRSVSSAQAQMVPGVAVLWDCASCATAAGWVAPVCFPMYGLHQ